MGRKPLDSITIWTRIDVRGVDECWMWNGPKDRYGYGKFQIGGKNWKPHRFICVLVHGERDSNWYAIHSCDNRSCCNPAHLRWGTAKENAEDRMIRKRHAPAKRMSDEDRSLGILLLRRGVRASLVAEVIGCTIKHAVEMKSKIENPPPHPPLAGA